MHANTLPGAVAVATYDHAAARAVDYLSHGSPVDHVTVVGSRSSAVREARRSRHRSTMGRRIRGDRPRAEGVPLRLHGGDRPACRPPCGPGWARTCFVAPRRDGLLHHAGRPTAHRCIRGRSRLGHTSTRRPHSDGVPIRAGDEQHRGHRQCGRRSPDPSPRSRHHHGAGVATAAAHAQSKYVFGATRPAQNRPNRLLARSGGTDRRSRARGRRAAQAGLQRRRRSRRGRIHLFRGLGLQSVVEMVLAQVRPLADSPAGKDEPPGPARPGRSAR
jgi:hypothetical protein